MTGKLEGKVALITGAGSGIGAETARQMAAEGADVSLLGIPPEGLRTVAAEISEAGHSALALPTDVSDSIQIQTAMDQTAEQFGRLDIIVASAAVQMHMAPLSGTVCG